MVTTICVGRFNFDRTTLFQHKHTANNTHLPPLVVGVLHDTSMDPASKLATDTSLGADAGRG
jgi:hypothetical protein